MKYYKGNGLYDYLEKHNCKNFYFVKGDMWWLIYGDKESTPKLLVLACAVTEQEYQSDTVSSTEERAHGCLDFFANRTSLPKLVVRFSGEAEEVDKVKIEQSEDAYQEITMKTLKKIFVEKGLDIPLKKQTTNKYLNTDTSSAYHIWQRTELGSNITVCDLDLLKWKKGTPLQIYELKRSIIDLDTWKPYEDDYANFVLVSKFAQMAKMDFQIVYNVRVKQPYYDNVTQLKIFDFDYEREPKVKELGVIDIEDFVK